MAFSSKVNLTLDEMLNMRDEQQGVDRTKGAVKTDIKEVAWYTTPVGEGVGYGVAAVETIRGLQRKGLKVSFDERDPLVHISFIQPFAYSGNPYQYRIGYTPWESDEVPSYWLPDMRSRDELWTTSNYCKDVFEAHDANEIIRVVPHGIDPEIWSIQERFVADKFMFLHVGGTTARKGAQRVVDAFLDVFGDNEDVVLLLKSNGPTEARWSLPGGRYMGSAANHPRILNIDKKLDVYDLTSLYHQAHCMVYPTNGEGFGLIPFQAIATGMPTIVTNATACADFAELSIPLDWTPTKGNGVHLGNWAEPDYDDLCKKMEDVYLNFPKHSKKAMQGAKIIHSTQTWDHVADIILDILGDKIYYRL